MVAPEHVGDDRPMSRVSLLDIEPALGAQLCPDQFRDARNGCTATVVALERGARRAHGDESAFFVIRGVLTRRLTIGDRRGLELVGRGDVVYPASTAGEWRVEETALLGLLDEHFHRCAATWPRLTMALQERSVLRSHSLLVRLAIVEHPHIVQRVHLVLWHLADRWGTLEPEGAFLPLKLSRVALADLVCSTRESVSRSLGELERRGDVRARGTGYFLSFPAPT